MLLDYQILESRLIHEWGTPTIYTMLQIFHLKKKELDLVFCKLPVFLTQIVKEGSR
jgi:hypothetical protein